MILNLQVEIPLGSMAPGVHYHVNITLSDIKSTADVRAACHVLSSLSACLFSLEIQGQSDDATCHSILQRKSHVWCVRSQGLTLCWK